MKRSLPARLQMVFCVGIVLGGLVLVRPGLMMAQLPNLLSPGSSQPAGSSPAKEQPPLTPIPPAEIASQAEEVSRQLRDMSQRFSARMAPANLGEYLPSATSLLEEERRETMGLLESPRTHMELRELERHWKSLAGAHRQSRNKLTNWGKQLDKEGQDLTLLEQHWKLTEDFLSSAKAPELAVIQVRATLNAIAGMKNQWRSQLSELLVIQGGLARQGGFIAEIQERIDFALDQYRVRIWTRDSAPLWQASRLITQGESQSSLGQLFFREWLASTEFLRTQRLMLFFCVLSFCGVLPLLRRLNQEVAAPKGPHRLSSDRTLILERPYSIASFLTLSLFLLLSPVAPLLIKAGAVLLLAIPLLRLFPLLTSQEFHALILALPVFYFLAIMTRFVAFAAALERLVSMAAGLVICLVLVWFLRPSMKNSFSNLHPKYGRWIIRGLRTGFVLVLLSCLANLLGFFTLASLLLEGTIFSSYLALMLIALGRICRRLLEILLETGCARKLAFFRLPPEQLTLGFSRFMLILSALIWVSITLDLFSIRRDFVNGLAGILSHPVTLGSLSFSLANIIAFILVLCLGYGLSRLLQFLLREELLSRMPLERGVPAAISTIFHYLFMVLIFWLGMGAAGVQMNQLSLLTGALGVGVGFGLQNIVNNFVSGLILLFERPIHEGDVLEINNLSGEVKRIGMRSSTLHTFQGAEVIVPNSNLVSNQVINWTLSEQRRRVDLPVGVAYGSDFQRVQQMLLQAALSHPKVLPSPEPVALFVGFGENALNFELRFWVPDPFLSAQLKSEVGFNVVRVLAEAGISIPFPQRDLHIITRSSSAAEPPPGLEESKEGK